MFATINHPVLSSIDPKDISKFLKDREKYEDEIEEKRNESPSIQAASYKVSIDRTLLNNMHFLGKFKDIAPGVTVKDLSSNRVEALLRGMVSRSRTDDVDPGTIHASLNGLKMKMTIRSAEARILDFLNNCFSRLEGVGYGDFKKNNPRKTIKLIQEKLYPVTLREALKERVELRDSLGKDLHKFIAALIEEAEIDSKRKRSSGYHGNSVKKETKTGESSSSTQSKFIPICLYPPCQRKGVRHHIRDCRECSKEEGEKLLKEFMDKKYSKKVKKAFDSVLSDASKTSSIHVETTFANSVTRIVCNDIGSDINLMPSSLFTTLPARGAEVEVKVLAVPGKFGLAVMTSKEAENLFVECDRTVKLNIDLHIRHGKLLKIRNTFWFVAIPEQFTEEPLLGLPLLEALGLRTKEILEAACDKYSGEVDANDFVPEQKNIGQSISRLVQRGIFHSETQIEPDDNMHSSSDIPIYLGVYTEEEKNSAVRKMLENAKARGISIGGLKKLEEVVYEYSDVFRIRLENDPPAKVSPMMVKLNSNAVPFKANTRRYKPEQYKFLEIWTKKLEEYGFIRKCYISMGFASFSRS